ncbi:hypothetical protein [Paraburkholderia sediminicola]|uniref:hypothetical protein n=1 Tax=Paraburkholderia sediminicola TaxID=458836 RepID=UPI0038BA458D
MSQVHLAQAEPSAPENPLNNRFDFFSATRHISNALVGGLNNIHQALNGMCAISSILEANEVEKCDGNGTPLNDNLAGGLFAAMSTLAKFAQGELELLGAETGHE